jgi:hypothetical protein
MKVSFEFEVFSFFASVVLAILIGIVYDFFRAVRKVLKSAVLCDILMWITVSFLVVWTWFFVFFRVLRWYMILDVFFTGVIYFLTVSRYTYFLFQFVVDNICLVFGVILKILLTPPRFLCKMLCVYIGRFKSKFSKKVEGKCDEKKA